MVQGEAVASDPSVSATAPPADIRVLVTENFAFVWRSLVRLGVPRADAEDAVQQVFLVASRKVSEILPGRERSFLFAIVLRIAWRARRTQQRRREVLDPEPEVRFDPAPDPEQCLDQAQARAELAAILDKMPFELRTVFVLFELEQASTQEIAALLAIPKGTVASRLRRAREVFEAAVRRLSEQRRRRGEP